jgi:SAM-dependent methyltransferase
MRATLPAMREHLLRARDIAESGVHRVTGEVLRRGSAVACPCCGASFDAFANRSTRQNCICWRCGSAERHRALWLYLVTNRESMLRPPMRVLHVAPERPLRGLFDERPGIEYIAGDLEQRFGSVRVDVTSLSFTDASFDAVLCNHVLEHVPDDRQALGEIRRVLRTGGWATLLIPPMLRDETYEDPSITTRAGRLAAFGQSDYVRICGRDYLDRYRDAGFEVETVQPDEVWPASDVARYRLGAGYSSVLLIGRPACAANV